MIYCLCLLRLRYFTGIMDQVKLADEINKLSRLLGCQFIIATHSPFMLGTLHAKIYNIDSKEYDEVKWSTVWQKKNIS